MKHKTMHRLMNEAGDGTGSEGGGGGGGVAPTPVADAGAPAAAPTPAPSVLSAGAAPAPWQAPDKYVVKNGDDIDWQATARKIDEGRSHLEKRFGAGDVPPTDVAGYKLAVPEQYAETLQGWDPAADQSLQAFLGNAHKAGFTQQQLDLVLGEYGRVMSEVKGASAQPSPEQQAEATAADLRKAWANDGEFDKNVGLAFKAANALASKAGLSYDDVEAAGLGNNGAFLRIMAAIGAEMGEDTPVGTQGGAASGGGDWKGEVAALRAEKAALPERDPRRETIQARINALYDKHTPQA